MNGIIRYTLVHKCTYSHLKALPKLLLSDVKLGMEKH